MLDRITVHGARQHNLKNISVEIPRNTFTVITGLSGSGKSSLAFDTIYAEGQRRYVETLSPYARQFLDQMERPEVDSIDGLSPAISIEQKTTTRSPRSTAFLASRPAASMTLGLEVLVQEVMAAITTEPVPKLAFLPLAVCTLTDLPNAWRVLPKPFSVTGR